MGGFVDVLRKVLGWKSAAPASTPVHGPATVTMATIWQNGSELGTAGVVGASRTAISQKESEGAVIRE